MDNHSHTHQYVAAADLRQLIHGRHTHFQSIPQPPELFLGHRGQPFEMMHIAGLDLMPRGGLHEFPPDSGAAGGGAVAAVTSASTPSASGFDGDAAGFGVDSGTGRWPRQETLTLLEIRSRLDSQFKEANQKGPLWDEVSRIMCEEHGYQRSGKKCREKFENLYKYYKKTKEGKAGRQDGKHYRFFRQLEALCGDTSNSVNSVSADQTHHHLHLVQSDLGFHNINNPNSHEISRANQEKLCDSLSLSNSSELEPSSSDDDENGSSERRRKRGAGWKAKIKELIDLQMRKLISRQEAWLEKLTKTLEQKEQERLLREEEWRQQEAARAEREHKFWARERAWMEARDAALLEALQALTGRQQIVRALPPEDLATAEADHVQNDGENGCETEKKSVVKEWKKKHKESWRTNYRSSEAFGEAEIERVEGNEHGSWNVTDNCYKLLMGEGENLWENYGMNINRGQN